VTTTSEAVTTTTEAVTTTIAPLAVSTTQPQAVRTTPDAAATSGTVTTLTTPLAELPVTGLMVGAIFFSALGTLAIGMATIHMGREREQ
jgi:hypothetical protein